MNEIRPVLHVLRSKNGISKNKLLILWQISESMMEKEISKTYYFDSADYDNRGRRKTDGKTFRDVVKEFEFDFHDTYTTEYALNLYANSQTMDLLARSNDAAPFLLYGMDLTQGHSFDPINDPFVNHEMDKHSERIYVYGIDSAFMTEFDEYGYPILEEDSGIFPLTLLVDNTMRVGEIRLAVPTLDDGDEKEDVTIDVPQFEYA